MIVPACSAGRRDGIMLRAVRGVAERGLRCCMNDARMPAGFCQRFPDVLPGLPPPDRDPNTAGLPSLFIVIVFIVIVLTPPSPTPRD
ncbi:hypothetical protein, partial [Paraburkholderia piptadeniae]|uniref:hypothetical protein n=1 Tax=Paraburkholderia piptadeniae TaxID=1701573 RepID=UPI001C441EB4